MAFLLCALVGDHDICLEEMFQCVPHVLSEMVCNIYVTVKLFVSYISRFCVYIIVHAALHMHLHMIVFFLPVAVNSNI